MAPRNKQPNVYRYTDYRAFLKAMLAYKQRRNRHFSLRCFAQMAGIRSHSLLNEVITGKRNLTADTTPKIIKPFGLTTAQAAYFTQLVRFNQAKTEHERNRLFAALLRKQKQPEGRTISATQFEYFSDWFNSAVRALITLDDFNEDPAWIARKLHPFVTPAKAARALRLLERLGLVRRGRDGKLEQETPRLDIDPDVSHLAIRNFNRSMIRLAGEAIERFRPDDREISGTTISVSDEGYRCIKEMVRTFKKQVADFVNDDPRTAETVCQLNLQLFPLVRKVDDDA